MIDRKETLEWCKRKRDYHMREWEFYSMIVHLSESEPVQDVCGDTLYQAIGELLSNHGCETTSTCGDVQLEFNFMKDPESQERNGNV